MRLRIFATLLLLVPLAGAASTTLADNDPDTYTGHVGVDSATLTSDGTDVTYVINVDAFDVNQPATEYYLNVETEDYRSLWVECTIEGTGSGYATACDVTAQENMVPTGFWDTYYGLGVPTSATHRLAPYVQTGVLTHTVVFDASAGTIGATVGYADQGFSSGQRIQVTVFGAFDGTTRDAANPQQWVILA